MSDQRKDLPGPIQDFLLAVRRSNHLPPHVQEDVHRELTAHFEDGLEAGRSPEDLIRELGDPGLLSKRIRKARGPRGVFNLLPGTWGERIESWLSSFLIDFHQTLRGLLRTPTYAVVTTLTLALGIGATTSIFSVINGVLLRPIPFHEAEELVLPLLVNPGEGVTRGQVGYADYLQWRQESGIFQSVGLYLDWNCNITGESYPERIKGAVVSPGFFDVLRAPPHLGRFFSLPEHDPGAGRAVVLDQGFWERRFGGDASVLGSTVLLDGQGYEVVGVAAPGSRWPPEAEFWIPLTFGETPPAWVLELDARAYSAIARLAEGVHPETATLAVDQLARRAALERPDTREGFGARVAPLRSELVSARTQRALLLLLACSGLVLLIASANVANLTLERVLSREGDVAVRAAIGAGLRRSVRPLAWEVLLMTLLGGGAGVLVAVLGTPALLPQTLVGGEGEGVASVDLRFLAFAVLVTCVVGVSSSLFTVFARKRLDLGGSLRGGGRLGNRRGREKSLRRLGIGIQLSLSTVVVLGAMLTVGATRKLLSVDPGFDRENLMTMKVFLPHRAHRSGGGESTVQTYRHIVEALSALPGAESASVVSALPLSSDGVFQDLAFQRWEDESGGGGADHLADWVIVGAGYFHTLSIDVLSGRTFSADDGREGRGVVVLSEGLARTLFPHEDPVGRQIRALSRELPNGPLEVIGVVSDVLAGGPGERSQPAVYVPQGLSSWRAMAVVARFTTDPTGREEEVREAVWGVEPTVPVTSIRTMASATETFFAPRRLATRLVSTFALLALALAAVGVYGVVNVSLRERRQELGVRKALGAQGGEIFQLLLAEGGRLLLLGGALAIPLTLLLSPALSHLIPGSRGASLPCLMGVLLVMALSVLLASSLPALRATRVEAAEALRGE